MAPCCDCVYSFVTLPCPSCTHTHTHDWHCHQMEREEGEGRGKTDRGQEQSRLISCALSPSLPFCLLLSVKTGHFLFSKTCLFNFKPTSPRGSRTQLAPLVEGLGRRRPGSSYSSVGVYHSHGALPARAVLRSAKIS